MPIIDRTPKMRDVIISEGDLVQGTSNGGEVRLPIGPVAGRIRRKLGDNKLSYDTSPHLNVRDYGAVGDGITDDTVAVAACFSDSDLTNIPVRLPKGTYLTDTINYRMQSIIGTHPEQCIFLGKPGQDILHVDPTFGQFTRQHGRLEKFTLKLNDSVDASASFPNRGGVGNACYAMDFNDSALIVPYPPTTIGWVYNHVRFASTSETSGGLNNSAGIYQQSNHFAQCVWYRPHFYRLQYGWWDHYPNLNISGRSLSHDHVNVYQPHFNLCKNNWRMVNWGFGDIQDVIMHNAVGGTAWEMKAVTAGPSNSRNLHDLHISGLEMEIADVAGLVTDDGCYNIFFQNATINGCPAPLIWNASHSIWRNVSMVPSGTPTVFLTINGNENDIEVDMDRSVATDFYGWNFVNDLGAGNRVVNVRRTGSLSTSMRHKESDIPDGRVLHQRDTVSQLLGYVDPMFVSGNDLILNGRDIIPSGQVLNTDFTYVADATADFRVAYRSLLASCIVNLSETVWGFNGRTGARVGAFLPASKVRIYFKAKLGTAGTMSVKLRTASGGVIRNVGGAGFVASIGTAYSVFSFDADLTGRPNDEILDFRFDTLAGGGVGPLDIAWIAFRPWALDWLVTGAITSGALTAKTTTYTATANDQVIECDATGGAFSVNLPAVASTAIGKTYTIKKTDSSANAVTLDPNASETIDGSTTKTLAVQYEAITVVNNGATWRIENNQGRVHGTLAIDGATNMKAALDHDGTTAGFFNITPVTRPTAYTQTYATADKTHANFTSADLTGITSSTTGSALAEPSAAYTQAEMQQNFRRIQDQFVALRADVADIKQLVNSVVDDLQALGLLQ